MSSFEEKLRKSKKEFDVRDPEKEHLARFILKLEKDQDRFHRRHTPWYYSRAAAAIIILVAASYFVLDMLLNPTSQQGKQIAYNTEMNEIMTYYDNMSSEKLAEIEIKTTDNAEAARLKELAYGRVEDIDSKLAAIEKEYMKNPDNEMLKAALINNRRKKAEIMQNILLRIDFANSQLY